MCSGFSSHSWAISPQFLSSFLFSNGTQPTLPIHSHRLFLIINSLRSPIISILAGEGAMRRLTCMYMYDPASLLNNACMDTAGSGLHSGVRFHIRCQPQSITQRACFDLISQFLSESLFLYLRSGGGQRGVAGTRVGSMLAPPDTQAFSNSTRLPIQRSFVVSRISQWIQHFICLKTSIPQGPSVIDPRSLIPHVFNQEQSFHLIANPHLLST